MDELTKIAYNCKKATLLIEKKLISNLTLREKLELKIHLAGCSVCRIFEHQSKMINTMVKQMFKNGEAHDIRLDENFKKDLQQRIDNELDKK